MRLLLLALVPTVAFAQATPTAKQAPPPGIAVPENDRAELQAGLDRLGKKIEALRVMSNTTWEVISLLPDAEVLHKAVRYAVQYGEFFNPKEIVAAKAQLALGEQRAKELNATKSGKPSWAVATGPLVLAYTSKIDGSAQPYGLIVPDDWTPGDKTPRPLYLWFHGRGDTLSEVAFISSRLKAKRDFAPANAFELHLYGRYCNASKFAGETDAFEAMDNVKKRYAIDENRIVPMGFSMGGATIWHMATHHAGLWAVASGGAGFAETAIYAKVFDEKKEVPPWWEQVLWRLYDATDYAANLANVPLVAYSGEIDPQKQSGDLMEKICASEGIKLERVIGPNTGHKYEPEAKKEVSRRVDAYMQKGREPLAPHVRFVTYTLRYNTMKWITVDALEKHWERASIYAHLADEGTIRVMTKNVTAFTIAFPAGPVPLDLTRSPRVVIDEQETPLAAHLIQDPPIHRPGWTEHFRKTGGKWAPSEDNHTAPRPPNPTAAQRLNALETYMAGPVKRHGLQGPIDDAFMDSFIFVRPTGKALNDKVGAWTTSELDRAIVEWRKVFRGDARVKDDTALTPDDIANANLILWGDPGSNTVLAKMLNTRVEGTAPSVPRTAGHGSDSALPSTLPLKWTRDQLVLGTQTVSAADHAPILIFPNPLNPQRYVVLNSSFTFRMGAKTSNSLQTPKLPDWAVIDLKTPPNDLWPGQVVDAGFFDEHWQFPAR